MSSNFLTIDFIYTVASRLSDAKPGRTALMKLAYFAQELENVPLGYNFKLYSYGPFDSSVLNDLDIAKNMGAVDVGVVHHSLGYGYQVSAKDGWHPDSGIEQYSSQINQIVQRFGHLKPSELELLSTLIYVDRNSLEKKVKLTLDQLVENTGQIKPHFTRDVIKSKAQGLQSEGLLKATNAPNEHSARP